MAEFELRCVLFDLDGTLVDTAPDLIACLNETLQAHGQAAVEPEGIRPFISYGARAMIENSLTIRDADFIDALLTVMLDRYQHNIARHSRLFAGLDDALMLIEGLGWQWGVVTNKRERFTLPLMEALNLHRRAACIISGDTTANSKPHPEPMFAACQQAQVAPEQCVYIGDAQHDITAGRAAGMKTLAALYGYLKPDDSPARTP
jgi:phosphoglycolate phosphatase